MVRLLSRSKLFNPTFIHKIRDQVANTKKNFLDSMNSSVDKYSRLRSVSFSQDELDYAVSKVLTDVVDFSTLEIPSLGSVYEQVNFKASAGLPIPHVKKRDLKQEIYALLESFYAGELNFNDILSDTHYFSAAFMRNQITSSGLKTRLVFAVNYIVVVIETYFNITFKSMISSPNSDFAIGRTQQQISDKVLSFRGGYNMSFDVKGFDNSVPRIVIITSFKILEGVLPLSSYQLSVFKWLRNYFVTLPLFHPLIKLVSRQKGITSGSGFTSVIGSMCMYFMHCVTLYRYTKQVGMSINNMSVRIVVSGDDSIVSTSQFIDNVVYSKLMQEIFGVELELEFISKPGDSEIGFLGSVWKDGVPFRDVNRMFGRIAFGSSNFPEMTEKQMFSSRCFEILGHVGDFEEIWSSFRLPLERRIFRFSELSYHNVKYQVLAKQSRDNRGFWTNVDPLSDLNSVWRTR